MVVMCVHSSSYKLCLCFLSVLKTIWINNGLISFCSYLYF
jgi:hypothetical protein